MTKWPVQKPYALTGELGIVEMLKRFFYSKYHYNVCSNLTTWFKIMSHMFVKKYPCWQIKTNNQNCFYYEKYDLFE